MLLSVAIAVTLLILAFWRRDDIKTIVMEPKHNTKTKTKTRTICWFVDDSQVNSRQWIDFMARSTREPNEPYLKVCLSRAQELWGKTWTIEPVIGRDTMLNLLKSHGAMLPDGVSQCPPALFMHWCRATYLATFGGLWMDGSVLPLAGGLDMGNNDVLMFGQSVVGSSVAGSSVVGLAGSSAGWSKHAGHPMWNGLSTQLSAQIAAGPQTWTPVVSNDVICSHIDQTSEVSHDGYGRRIELDTLLGSTSWGVTIHKDAKWLILPDGRDGLERASPYAWFTRLSVDQIMESDFIWAQLARG